MLYVLIDSATKMIALIKRVDLHKHRIYFLFRVAIYMHKIENFNLHTLLIDLKYIKYHFRIPNFNLYSNFLLGKRKLMYH